jgi:hypothetical protein
MSAKFTLGGVKHDLRIELKDAPKFEDATGLGFMEMLTAFVDKKSATTTQVIAVLGTAFSVNGKHYSDDEIMAMIERDEAGFPLAYAAAGIVLMQLVLRPKGDDTGKKYQPAKGRGAQANSH